MTRSRLTRSKTWNGPLSYAMSAVTRQAANALNANKSGSEGCRSNKRYLVSTEATPEGTAR